MPLPMQAVQVGDDGGLDASSRSQQAAIRNGALRARPWLSRPTSSRNGAKMLVSGGFADVATRRPSGFSVRAGFQTDRKLGLRLRAALTL
jgi:hypothetical protein